MSPFKLAGPEFQLVIEINGPGVGAIHIRRIKIEIRQTVMRAAEGKTHILLHPAGRQHIPQRKINS